MRHIIIDALNLINYDNNTQQVFINSYEKGCKLFLDYLHAYALKFPKYRITAVFDGRLGDVFSGLPNLYLEESGKRIADRVIIEYINNSINPKSLTIVSSDKEILDFAKRNYSDYYRAEEFWLELKMAIESNISNDEIENYKKPKLDSYNFKEENNYFKFFDENPIDKDFLNSSFVKDKSNKNFLENSNLKDIKSTKKQNYSKKKTNSDDDVKLDTEKLKNKFNKNNSHFENEPNPKIKKEKEQKIEIEKDIEEKNIEDLETSFDDFMELFKNEE